MGEKPAFAWIDDEITEADRAWVNEHHSGPVLLYRVDLCNGITSDDLAALTAWATGLRWPAAGRQPPATLFLTVIAGQPSADT
ncbi:MULTISPECIES: hypothetical protein [unclassified Streptomyces]|uniref:hypothetical protein n=1 Tax=unclassified Streptomyces TaxID=2593676 RepID=UPI0036F6C1DD